MENSDILVHISAPSGARDDTRYRAQVEAILGFQCRSRQLITLSSDACQESGAALATGQSSSPGRAGDVDTQDKSKCIQPLLSGFRGTDDAELPVCSRGITEEPATVLGEPSNARSTPTTIGSDLQVDRRHGVSGVPLPPELRGVQAGNDSLESPVSVIPDSQPERPHAEAESLPRSGSQVRGSSLAVDCLPAKRHCVGLKSTPRDVELTTGTTLPAPNLDEQRPGDGDPHFGQQIPPKSIECQLYICLDILPLMIKPPPPPISKEQFVTHITPTLAMLTRRLKPARTYKPVKQIRDLDQLERGHWYLRINIISSKDDASDKQSIQPGTWDLASFSRFWTFLSDFISKEGRAGWGVWCILEDAHEPNAPCSPECQATAHRKIATIVPHQAMNPTSTARAVILKLYAWGEIALHMYLLLFLASERRVRKIGAQWRDGQDKVRHSEPLSLSSEYIRKHAPYHDGDALDIIWTSEDRKKRIFDGKDPLEKKFRAIEKRTVQLA